MRDPLTVRIAVEVFLATVAAALVYRYARRQPARVAALGSRFDAYAARRALLFIGVAALLPLLLRLAVLPWVPPRVPKVHDEYGHLLVADTLAHGRLANPPHPLAPHLETFFVFQRPAYASRYPLGQGLTLAVGTLLTGVPWPGVWLSVALMCGGIAWMLFGAAPAGWAAIGGVLCAIVLGATHGWIDMLYGGAFCAFGGAVLFGSLLRLRRGPSALLGFAAGVGWSIVWLTRPYESLVPLLFTSAIVLCFVVQDWRKRSWAGTLALLAIAPLGAGGLTALHNRAVTGSFTTLPYVLYQRTHGADTLVFQRVEPTELGTPELREGLRYNEGIIRERRARPFRYVWTIVERTWRFFLRGWLCLPVLLGLAMLRDPVTLAGATMLAGALLTSSLYHSFFPHYWAAYSGVLFLLAVRGLAWLPRLKPFGLPIGIAAAAFFVAGTMATVVRAVPIGPILGVSDYGYEAPLRQQVADRLNAIEGQHVVFVKYGPSHSFFTEWVHNAADVDAARIVWCRAIGPDDDARVVRYYAGRQFWLAEVDARTVRVTRLSLAGRPPSPEDSSQKAEVWVLTAGP